MVLCARAAMPTERPLPLNAVGLTLACTEELVQPVEPVSALASAPVPPWR